MLLKIKQNINNISAEKKKITIIAVTKTHPFESIESAIENGIFNIGENKVQETEKKTKDKTLPQKVKLHLIGHLQTNKVKKAILLYDCIQTVDSIKLAQKIHSIASGVKKKQKVFLQINIANKKEKKGFLTSEIIEAAQKIQNYSNISIKGVMIIPPPTEDKNTYLGYFKAAQKIQKKIQKKIPNCKNISMGMSGDYVEAIKMGATHIRIGTALFGERVK